MVAQRLQIDAGGLACALLEAQQLLADGRGAASHVALGLHGDGRLVQAAADDQPSAPAGRVHRAAQPVVVERLHLPAIGGGGGAAQRLAERGLRGRHAAQPRSHPHLDLGALERFLERVAHQVEQPQLRRALLAPRARQSADEPRGRVGAVVDEAVVLPRRVARGLDGEQRGLGLRLGQSQGQG